MNFEEAINDTKVRATLALDLLEKLSLSISVLDPKSVQEVNWMLEGMTKACKDELEG